MATRTILIFIDGLGWGDRDPLTNPMHTYGGRIFDLPARPPLGQELPIFAGGLACPIDAVLGVAGIPQSATGQTTLLSGINAQEILGKHLTGFPNLALRKILAEYSVLKVMTQRGRRACFLNAFRPLFWELSTEQQWKLSATTVANLAAGLPFFTLQDIDEGRAIYQDISNQALQDRGFAVRNLMPADAGRVLAQQALHYEFLLFEFFQTDEAGHSADTQQCHRELARLDEFLCAILSELASELQTDTLVVLTSDHGNLEDTSTRHHTTNPIPLMAWGSGAADFLRGISRLDQVTPGLLARHTCED